MAPFSVSFLSHSLSGVLGDAQKAQETSQEIQALEPQCCSKTAEAGTRSLHLCYNFRCAHASCITQRNLEVSLCMGFGASVTVLLLVIAMCAHVTRDLCSPIVTAQFNTRNRPICKQHCDIGLGQMFLIIALLCPQKKTFVGPAGQRSAILRPSVSLFFLLNGDVLVSM
jgi:hypothetical protein